ncbi:MAG: PDZ domain-containing protein [Planctomycetaceae bacterium]
MVDCSWTRFRLVALPPAGLATGDVVVSLNGQSIATPSQFYEYLTDHAADELRMLVLRDGVQQVVSLSSDRISHDEASSRPALGVRFRRGDQVILGEVLAGSPAANAGLQAGDHLVGVAGTSILSTDHFINLVAAAPLHDPLRITAVRGSQRVEALLTPLEWKTVFGTNQTQTTLKPVVNGLELPTNQTYVSGPPWYSSGVSPVGVPLIAFPTYYGMPYGYTYWAPPVFLCYGGYYAYPNWYIYTGTRLAVPPPTEHNATTGF